MASNLYDSYILQDASVFLKDYGLIGMTPSIQVPALSAQTESFRGAGMDGEVEITMGIEKIEWEFDMFTVDPEVWKLFGFGPGAMQRAISFQGYLQTPSGSESIVEVVTQSLIKSIKPGKFEPGKKTDTTVSMNCSKYAMYIAGEKIIDIDLFAKKTFILGGVSGGDVNSFARQVINAPSVNV